MIWKKLGLMVKPGPFDWMHSHAQNPFVEKIGDANQIKIHFATRDRNNQAQGAFAIFDMTDHKVIQYSESPTVALGELGCFDDCGAMPSCIVNHNDKQIMYYTGWSRAVKTPFSFFIGALESNDGGLTYQRISRAPVLGRTYHDPFMTAMPWIFVEKNIWRMWYVSCSGWNQTKSEIPKHYYRICYAESNDGVNWINNGKVCIDYGPGEYAFGRPMVFKDESKYKMLFSYRGKNTYRLGYAESKDGLNWQRMDEQVGIEPSPSGWDSEMICYSSVFEHQGKTYMLYNGNTYGKDGTGLAILEK